MKRSLLAMTIFGFGGLLIGFIDWSLCKFFGQPHLPWQPLILGGFFAVIGLIASLDSNLGLTKKDRPFTRSAIGAALVVGVYYLLTRNFEIETAVAAGILGAMAGYFSWVWIKYL